MEEVRRCTTCFEVKPLDDYKKSIQHYKNKTYTCYYYDCKKCYYARICRRLRCECGRYYTYTNKKTHLRSHMHKEWLLDKSLYYNPVHNDAMNVN